MIISMTGNRGNFMYLGDVRCSSVWYMYLKIENIYLDTQVKIYVDEKIYKNMYNVV